MEKEVVVDGKVINLEVVHGLVRSGTPPGNKSSGVWEVPSTEEPTAACWSTT